MRNPNAISRRQFVTSAVSAAAVSSLGVPRVFGGSSHATAVAGGQTVDVSLTGTPSWKDQAIENLAKSPHAKLRQIPVRAVTIKTGFWGQRREINVSKSIPTMHDLLEANGRMNNFRRLVGQERRLPEWPGFLRLRRL